MANKKKAQPTGKASQKNAKAAAKVRAAQQQKRQRMQWSVGIIALVVVGIVVLVLVKISTDNNKATAATDRATAPASVVSDVAKVPIAKIATAHAARLKSDSSFKDLAAIKAPALTSGGKPRVMYQGAEYCPFCAAERWPMAVALSKFGTFTDLKTVTSSSTDNPSDVPTLSFYGSTYKSDYLTFTPTETEDRNNKPLEKATAADSKILAKYDFPPYVPSQGGGIPFIDFGGKYIQSGASYDPSILIGKTQKEIAGQLDGTGDIPANVNATAGSFIKAICTLTKGQPGNVCKPLSAG